MFGTFICGECADFHIINFPMSMSYIKPLTEVFDGFQLRVMQIGGNKACYDFIKEYGKERDDIKKKYDTDAAKFYRKMICFRARNVAYEERAPPKNAQEAAERAAEATAQGAKQAWNKTTSFF